MQWEDVAENWSQVSARLRQTWPSLTEDDLRFLDRTREALVARIHARTGLLRDTVERQLDAAISCDNLVAAPRPTQAPATEAPPAKAPPAPPAAEPTPPARPARTTKPARSN